MGVFQVATAIILPSNFMLIASMNLHWPVKLFLSAKTNSRYFAIAGFNTFGNRKIYSVVFNVSGYQGP